MTVNESSILKIETPEDRFAHGESEVILQSVKDLMFPRIIESQSIAVDAITGATASSNAVKLAMKKALQQALVEGGSDPSAVSAFMVPPAKPQVGEPEVIDVDVLVVGMGTGGIIAMKSATEEIQKLNGYQRVSVLGIDRAGKYGGKSALTHEGCAINPPRYQELCNNGEPYDDAEAFKRSLEEVVGWDWSGATLVVEHCDKYVPEQKPEKGFLSLGDEIDVVAEVGIGIHLNWGRSAVEGRDAETTYQHVREAGERGVLDGVVFSGAGPEETQYGYAWIDGHLPARADEPTSLMDAEQIGRCAQAALAGGAEYLGAKVCVPKDASLAKRLAMLEGIYRACHLQG